MRRGELLRGNISKDLKKRMVKALVWSVALYGSETWTLRKEDIKRIQAFEMWIWRKMEKISWTARVKWRSLVSGARTTFSGPRHQATPSKLDRTCLKTKIWLSSKDCTRGEDRRETAKRKTKKEDAGSTYGATGQEDQLRWAEERSTEPGRMTSSSLEPALGQSTQQFLYKVVY